MPFPSNPSHFRLFTLEFYIFMQTMQLRTIVSACSGRNFRIWKLSLTQFSYPFLKTPTVPQKLSYELLFVPDLQCKSPWLHSMCYLLLSMYRKKFLKARENPWSEVDLDRTCILPFQFPCSFSVDRPTLVIMDFACPFPFCTSKVWQDILCNSSIVQILKFVVFFG